MYLPLLLSRRSFEKALMQIVEVFFAASGVVRIFVLEELDFGEAISVIFRKSSLSLYFRKVQFLSDAYTVLF